MFNIQIFINLQIPNYNLVKKKYFRLYFKLGLDVTYTETVNVTVNSYTSPIFKIKLNVKNIALTNNILRLPNELPRNGYLFHIMLMYILYRDMMKKH